ncbi:hypothetical protein [Nocardiopsis alborubida]|uniref:Uncharacterized protein n=1 Tax=Nocardiopsis alborubida TaxID=146802 RepID=A0A7X6M8A0_9ACTN|nr:hypothetical protein [Nocardiopsis alborubida]NKY96498.1 hypothetical protein [Nocardiopsis alborubida]
MKFHRPGRPDDLPPPHVLWARGAALAALGVSRRSGLLSFEGQSLLYDDGGGNTWRLAWVEGDRAVLVGYDHEFSETLDYVSRPFDLLQDAPVWLPWTWIAELEAAECVAFVYWWDGAWARTPYPDDLEDDGLEAVLSKTSSLDGTVEQMLDCLLPGRRPHGELRAAARETARRVVLDAESGSLDKTRVEALLDLTGTTEPDAGAVLATARDGGLLPGTERPTMRAGRSRPERSRPASLGEPEWGLLVGDAMRRGREAERPTPAPSGALDDVADWIRANALDAGTSTTLTYGVTGGWRITKESGETVFGGVEAGSLLRALREAEAHPEHGRWFFLRMVVTAGAVEVERAYDHWPHWHAPRDPMDGRVWARSVMEELDGREPRWRPDWSRLASEETRMCGLVPAVEPGGAPSVTLTPMSREEQQDLLVEAGQEILRAAGEDWHEIRLSCWSLVSYTSLDLREVDGSGAQTPLRTPSRLRHILSGLREGMYVSGKGTWFGLEYVIERPGRFRVRYDYDTEPAFGLAPGDLSYALDALHFPREVEDTPAWLRRRLGWTPPV